MSRGNSRFHRAGLYFVFAAIAVHVSPAHAGVVWYVNDYPGWAAAAGDVHTIDFETLPDGSPSVASTPITLDFNYTDQGVTFTAPVAPPFISGNPTSTFGLRVDASPESYPNWITADLVSPAKAVGVWFPSATILEIYDGNDNLTDSRIATKGASLGFVGAISDIPVASSVSTRNSTHVTISSYHFAPIPEPATLILMGCAVMAVAGRPVARSPTALRPRHPHR